MRLMCLFIGCKWRHAGVLTAGSERLVQQTCSRCGALRTIAEHDRWLP